MNKQERELAESIIKVYYAIIDNDEINKRLDELNDTPTDENIGGSKGTRSNSAENSILRRLSDKRINYLLGVKNVLERKLQAFSDIEKRILSLFYSKVNNRDNRRSSKEVAEILVVPEEFCKKTRKKLINLVKNELFY